MDERRMRVDMVGINKVLSEEGEASQLVGEVFALRMSRQAVRSDFASLQLQKAGWREPSGVTGRDQGENTSGLFILSSLRVPCVGLTVSVIAF